MNNTITVMRSEQGWIAHFEGPHAADIRETFGTVMIPTAFTADAAATVVRDAIESANPDCEVYIRGERI